MSKYNIFMENGDTIILMAESGNHAINQVLTKPFYYTYEDIKEVKKIVVT